MAAAAMLALTLSVGAAFGPQPGPPTATIPEPLRAHLSGERFAPVAGVSALPAPVREGLRALFGDSTLELADPGKPFQSTDLVQTPRLPWRRLVAAGCAEDHCLVYYEKGGYAHVFYALVFQTTKDSATLAFGGTAPGGLSDLEAVKTAVTSGKVVGQTTTKYW
jgi:hypothetical protein